MVAAAGSFLAGTLFGGFLTLRSAMGGYEYWLGLLSSLVLAAIFVWLGYRGFRDLMAKSEGVPPGASRQATQDEQHPTEPHG